MGLRAQLNLCLNTVSCVIEYRLSSISSPPSLDAVQRLSQAKKLLRSSPVQLFRYKGKFYQSQSYEERNKQIDKSELIY